MNKKILTGLMAMVLSVAMHAQLTSADVTILFDGSRYGTSANDFFYEAHAGNNTYSKELVDNKMKWTLYMGNPANYDAIGILTFPAARDLSEHNKIVAKIKLSQYDKGFGIELRGLANESVASEVDWLDTVIAGQTLLWTNGTYPGSDTKTDVVPTTGGDWEYFEYVITRWLCSYPAHARIDSTHIMKLTPYYGYKSADSIAGDEVIIDYIVMVAPGASIQDVDTYMATVDTGPTEVNETSTSKVMLYPNPVNDILYIDNAADIDRISVLNLVGQQILSVNNKSDNCKINVSELKAGIYYCNIRHTNGNEESVKIIIR